MLFRLTFVASCALVSVSLLLAAGCASRRAGPTAPTSAETMFASVDSSDRSTLPPSRPPGTIFRTEVNFALARGPGWLLGQLGPEPVRDGNGAFAGWKITRVFPDAPQLCAVGCDLAPGDVVLAVNGDKIETPTALTDLIETLPQLGELSIVRKRGETRKELAYVISELAQPL